MSLRKIKVEEFMTAQAHTIRAGESLDKAQEHMSRFGVRHLPVLDGGKLRGILSDRDIKTAMTFKGANLKQMTVEDACTQEAYVTHPDSLLQKVAIEMAERRYGSAVVTDEDDKVVGIFTTTDACRALGTVLDPNSQQDRT